jgi:hypothetical protein
MNEQYSTGRSLSNSRKWKRGATFWVSEDPQLSVLFNLVSGSPCKQCICLSDPERVAFCISMPFIHPLSLLAVSPTRSAAPRSGAQTAAARLLLNVRFLLRLLPR